MSACSCRKARRNPGTKKPSIAAQVPQSQIQWIVGNIHVGTPDQEVADNIAARCAKAGASPALTKACVAFAVKTHRKNRDLYSDVMGGRIGSRRRSR